MVPRRFGRIKQCPNQGLHQGHSGRSFGRGKFIEEIVLLFLGRPASQHRQVSGLNRRRRVADQTGNPRGGVDHQVFFRTLVNKVSVHHHQPLRNRARLFREFVLANVPLALKKIALLFKTGEADEYMRIRIDGG